jgi:hypothetical protein
MKTFQYYYRRSRRYAEAVSLILAEWSDVTPTLYIGTEVFKSEKVAKWVEEGTTKPCVVKAFNLDEKELTENDCHLHQQGEIILIASR